MDHKTKNMKIKTSRKIQVRNESEIPDDHGTTPGGTMFSTTPGGTRLVYDRSFLLKQRESPLARSAPRFFTEIPGVTDVVSVMENQNASPRPRSFVLKKDVGMEMKKETVKKQHKESPLKTADTAEAQVNLATSKAAAAAAEGALESAPKYRHPHYDQQRKSLLEKGKDENKVKPNRPLTRNVGGRATDVVRFPFASGTRDANAAIAGSGQAKWKSKFANWREKNKSNNAQQRLWAPGGFNHGTRPGAVHWAAQPQHDKAGHHQAMTRSGGSYAAQQRSTEAFGDGQSPQARKCGYATLGARNNRRGAWDNPRPRVPVDFGHTPQKEGKDLSQSWKEEHEAERQRAIAFTAAFFNQPAFDTGHSTSSKQEQTSIRYCDERYVLAEEDKSSIEHPSNVSGKSEHVVPAPPNAARTDRERSSNSPSNMGGLRYSSSRPTRRLNESLEASKDDEGEEEQFEMEL